MEYIILNNEIKMPVLGFGTWALNGYDCIQAVSAAIESGYTLIDTAQMYGNEKEVGIAIKNAPRQNLFITTKLYSPNAGYEKAKMSIEQSLENLQTDYIDLLLIHEPYRQSLEMYKAMKEAYKDGKVRSIGISNFNSTLYLDFIKDCGVIPAVNQVESHVFYQQLNLKSILEQHGTHMQAWSPLAAGKNNFFKNEVLISIGEKYGKTSAQTALKYLIQSGIAAIPKSSNRQRIKSNIDIFDYNLTDDDMQKIKSLDTSHSLFGWY